MFSQYSKNDNIDAFSWLKAFTIANQTISEFGGAREGDRTMLDPLLSAQKKLEDSLSRKCHPIQAFGEAVRVAEECAIQTINLPGSSSKVSKVISKQVIVNPISRCLLKSWRKKFGQFEVFSFKNFTFFKAIRPTPLKNIT